MIPLWLLCGLDMKYVFCCSSGIYRLFYFCPSLPNMTVSHLGPPQRPFLIKMSGTPGATSFEDEPSTTIPDISLGSLEESFKSPAPIKAQRFVKPPVQFSASSTASTRIRTPSPNRKDVVRRISDEKTPKPNKQANGYFEEGIEEEGQTDTDRRWQSDNIPQRNKRGRPSSDAAKGGVNMTLRDQEKVRGTRAPVSQLLNIYLGYRLSKEGKLLTEAQSALPRRTTRRAGSRSH